MLRPTPSRSRLCPCSRRITISSNKRPTRSASTSSPVTVISLPRTWISTGKEASTSRSSSSRWPRRPTIRWLPGTRILTWVGDGVATSEGSYPWCAGIPAATAASPAVGAKPELATAPQGRGRTRSGVGHAGAQAELVEPSPQVLGPAPQHGGEHSQVVAADREEPAVEVLALELDRGRVPRQHRGL